MLSERILKQWRKEALIYNFNLNPNGINEVNILKDANIKIIKMTQELLDQCLLNK